MGRWAITALRVVLVMALAGAVVVQVVLLPLMWIDLDKELPGTRVAIVGIGLLGVGCFEVIGLSVWRLLTLVRRGTVFSAAAFRYVDRVIGAIAVGAVLIFGIAVVARFANRATPGDEVPPGVVALICGMALVAGGFSLLVYVLRQLLVQAMDLDARAAHLQSELDEVI